HGPAQVVAYPIFSIERCDGDVKQLVWRLEESIIDALRAHGLEATRREGLPGVWVDPAGASPRKIASVGLRLSRGVTFHGIAINVACDMEPFTWFTPCGIPDAVMTSLVRELGRENDDPALLEQLVRSVEARVAEAIATRFADGVTTPITVAELHAAAAAHPVEEPALTLPGEPRANRATRIDLAGAGT
ncbi:MAG: lipoyl(octanoyl) transferase LipB, partial [Gaiellales bacterium]